MLLLASHLKNLPVMSLQTGSELAKIGDAIIDPSDLQIVAYAVHGPLLTAPSMYLRVVDTRELSNIGFIVDSNYDFVESGDIIKLDELIHLGFSLFDKKVIDTKKRNLGRVIDYTIDVGTFQIQQLTVRRPLLRSLNDTELLVHRTQIREINNEVIVIESTAAAPEHTRQTSPGSYINPFRKSPEAAPESINQS